MANRAERRQDNNTPAKLSDIKQVYNLAVSESSLNASAMVTILCRMLIDHGILAIDEVNTLLSDEQIDLVKAELRQYLANREG